MLKKIVVVISVILFFGGVSFFLWRLLMPRRAKIEIKSFPESMIFINNKQVGKTPYVDEYIKPGGMEIKLVPDGLPGVEWKKNIDLSSQTHLLINRQFFQDDTKNEGEVLYLEKGNNADKAGLMLVSVPEGGSVTIDDQMKGTAPLNLEDVGSGEHRIAIFYPSYKTKEVVAKAVNGYRLVVEVLLAKSDLLPGNEASSSGTTKQESTKKEMIVIDQTPNGWLRVRNESSTSGKELARVNTGDEFEVLGEENDWFKIEYEKDKEGWVSGKYASKKTAGKADSVVKDSGESK